jgi:general secretion pathway protein F
MAVFAYEAMNETDQQVKGLVSGDTPRQARDSLRSQGLRVKSLVEEHAAPRGEFVWTAQLLTRPHAKVATFASELSTLLAVGVPLLEALDTLSGQARGAFKRSLALVRDQVSAGGSLAEAVAQQPLVFDELTHNLIEVGENAGNLDVVLRRLAQFKQKSLEFKDRVITALTYPAIVLCVSAIVTLFLMTYVVPMLLSNLQDAQKTLPWPTRVLKGMSDLLIHHGLVLGLLSITFLTAAIWGLRTQRGRLAWQRLLRRLPVVGEMWTKQEISRVSLVIATLMENGIEFIRAAEIAGKSTRSLLIEKGLANCCEAVRAGRDIGEALQQLEVFSPTVVHVFALGQKSGRMEEMLRRLAEDYDQQVASVSARLSSTVEPVLILLLALLVGFILFATVLPILEAGNVL